MVGWFVGPEFCGLFLSCNVMEGRFSGELASTGGSYDFDDTVTSLHSGSPG